MLIPLCLASLALGWGTRLLPAQQPATPAAAREAVQKLVGQKAPLRAAKQGPASPGNGWPGRRMGLRDLAPFSGSLAEELGLTLLTSSQSSTTATSAQMGAVWSNGQALYFFTVTITTPTNFQEKFVVALPSPLPQAPRPMLVAFHAFGVTALDIVQNTSLVQEAHARGWYLIAPLGASGVHFSSLQSQVNTQAVIDWMLARFPIDLQRIYGIGFSMGGGAAANYAARHLDPGGAMFAAVADHTGVAALHDVYVNDPSVTYILDFWFGNGSAGSASTFKLQRSSIFNFSQTTLQVDMNSNLTRNLMHVPFYLTRASSDPIWYLPRQNDFLDAHFTQLGKQAGVDYEYVVVPFTGHTWSMLDFTAVCDWLGQHSLQIPLAGRTLADHDGNYFHFAVQQDQAEAFTPFRWQIDPASNLLTLSETRNLARLRVDTVSAQLDTTSTLRVSLSTADGLADHVVLSDLQLPGQVLRDNVPAPAGSWSYNALANEVAILETDGSATHEWTIVP